MTRILLALLLLLVHPFAVAEPDYSDFMSAFPPPPDRLVTHANWIMPPWNRWAFKNLETLIPSTTVDRGKGVISGFHKEPVDLSGFHFIDVDAKDQTFASILSSQYVDSLLIWHKGNLITEQYRDGQTERTRHIMMSVTKSFTGLLAEMLIAEGKLDETALIGDYLPELKSSAYGDATLRQLMDMEIGIDFKEIYDDPTSDIYQFSFAANFLPAPAGVVAPASLYEYLPSLRKSGEHGQDFHYVTANSEVLGWVISRVTDTDFAKVFEQRIYNRIGAERDAFYLTDAHGKAVAGGGLNITARDLLRLGVMMAQEGYFNDQQIVAREIVQKIARGGTPRPSLWGNETGRDNSYKSQWYIHHPSHTYSAAGVHGQHIYVAPNERVVMVMQSSYPEADGRFMVSTDLFFLAMVQHLADKNNPPVAATTE